MAAETDLEALAGAKHLRLHGTLRRENAWPKGRRRIPCLACNRPFLSGARDERRCEACHRAAREYEARMCGGVAR